MAIAIGVYVTEKALDIDFTIIPLAFDVLMLGALIPIYDSNVYTVYENENIINEQLSKVGFLTFNKKREYKGCDDYMEHVFPELAQYRLGQRINNCSKELQDIINTIDSIEEEYEKHLA